MHLMALRAFSNAATVVSKMLGIVMHLARALTNFDSDTLLVCSSVLMHLMVSVLSDETPYLTVGGAVVDNVFTLWYSVLS